MTQDVIRTQVRIPKGIYKKAKAASKAQGISFNQFIIDALFAFDQQEKASSPTKVKEALDLISHFVGMKL